MSTRRLQVLINDQRVGTLIEESGIWGFQYTHCRRQFKIDHLCQLNFDQGSKAECLAPGCG